MAASTITITYVKPTAAPERDGASIAPLFVNPTSYADTTAYAGTVYDTNVKGFGELETKFPYDETNFPFPIPLAQFQLAMVGTSGTVSFSTEDYKEIFYYKQAGVLLASQGFTVTVS